MANSFQSELVMKQGASHSIASNQGKESSMCQPYGRSSSSSALATVERGEVLPDRLQLTLNAMAEARGGHYRTCSICVANECVGVRGHDTKGDASATARAEVDIVFDKATLPGPFKVFLGQALNADGAVRSFKLLAPDGSEVPFVDQRATIRGAPGLIYKLVTELGATAENEGGCCREAKRGVLSVNASIERAAIASANRPFILGGDFAAGYPEVGILVLKGLDGTLAAHCTGTVVGLRSVLTAAHCIAGDYSRALSERRMKFVLGPSMDSPTSRWLQVDDARIPDDPAPGGFQYKLISSTSGTTTEDDVALVYLDSDSGVVPVGLHSGNPTLMSLKAASEPLTMVGYGFYALSPVGVGSGSGKKRQAVLPISLLTSRTFGYESNAQNQSTCQGDSGGPALLEAGSGLWQVAGVTAFGSDSCTNGRSMRVDVYRTWIEQRLK